MTELLVCMQACVWGALAPWCRALRSLSACLLLLAWGPRSAQARQCLDAWKGAQEGHVKLPAPRFAAVPGKIALCVEHLAWVSFSPSMTNRRDSSGGALMQVLRHKKVKSKPTAYPPSSQGSKSEQASAFAAHLFRHCWQLQHPAAVLP